MQTFNIKQEFLWYGAIWNIKNEKSIKKMKNNILQKINT